MSLLMSHILSLVTFLPLVGAGVLLAVRRIAEVPGVTVGLDALLGL